MQNLSPSHVFLSQAFEPHRDEVRTAIRRSRAATRSTPQPTKSVAKKAVVDIDSDELLEMSSSSDEDMPDLSELLASAASSSQSSPARKKKDTKAKVKGRTIVSDDEDSPMDEVRHSFA